MIFKLDAKKREIQRKSDLKNLRKDGFVPAVVYAEGEAGKPITINQRDFSKLINAAIGGVAIIDLNIDGEEIQTIIKDKQIHPVSRLYTHVDFQILRKGKTLTLNIPIKYIGVPVGTISGGLLDVLHRNLLIECLPKDIPAEVVIDVTKLDLHDSIHVSDMQIKNVEIKMLADTALAVVLEPRGLDVDEEEEETDEEIVTTEEV